MKLRGIIALALALACAPAFAQVNPGTTPLSVAKGGTGGATAAAARTSLGAVGSSGSSTDRTIPTWNGTSGDTLRNNSNVGISSGGSLQMYPEGSATNVLTMPTGMATSSMCVGNGCTGLVHNAGTFTASISGTTMTVTAITTGTVPVERLSTATLSCDICTVGTQIRAQLTGSPGSTGTYTVSASQTVSSRSMTAISLQGYYNTTVGQTNFINATTASYNSFFGFETGQFCTTCFANSGFGEANQIYNIDGSGNSTFGWKAGLGTSGIGLGDYNTFGGYFSGASNATASAPAQNTAYGAFSLSGATLSGSQNAVFGYDVGPSVSSGSNNALYGAFAGFSLTTGSNNTLMGPNLAGNGLTTGSNNSIFGACTGIAGAQANLVKLCDGAGNVVFSAAGTGGGTSLGSQLNLASGGTAANLSATGGTSQVLKQVSTGAAITVGQLSGNDLTKGVYIVCMSAATGMTITGTLTETTLATCSIPGNTIGANGALRITTQWSKTGTAGTFETRTKFGGTTYLDQGMTGSGSAISGRQQTEIHNRNATNSQIGTAIGQVNWGFVSTASITTAIDTTASQDVTLTCQLGNTGDTCELSSYTVEVLKN